MSLTVCPTAVCHAPLPVVWSLLHDPQAWRAWVDAVVESVTPPGLASAGQRIRLRAPVHGRWFLIQVVIDRVREDDHILELHTDFPFALRMQNRFAATALDEASARVQFG